MPASIIKRRRAQEFISNNEPLVENIDSILKEISKNPFVDAKTKFYWSAPPAVLTLCVKGGLWVLYYLNSDCTQIEVWNIGKHGEKPTLR